MERIPLDEFHVRCRESGVPREHLAFKCPMCGTVQSMASIAAAGKTTIEEAEKYIGFSCVGRLTGAGEPDRKNTPPGRGCNWTLGGLLQCHKLEVFDAAGKVHPHFEFATADEAKQLMAATVPAVVVAPVPVAAADDGREPERWDGLS
jgi:hypothetical protein